MNTESQTAPTVVNYSVRRLGHAAYSHEVKSLRQARRDQRQALIRTGLQHVVVANLSDGTARIVEATED